MKGQRSASRFATALALVVGLNVAVAVQAGASSESASLASDLASIARISGAFVGISLIDLSGPDPFAFSYNGGVRFVAASTYKLPVLMYEGQGIASGRLHTWDRLCFRWSDWEAGPFSDYWLGRCFSRQTLAWRVAHYSDNTAAHILVRYMGGTYALNAYARAHGAVSSAFFNPNLTTSGDLARLWRSEALGYAGGAAAQAWLFPLLRHTLYESGIPAGVPSGAAVMHKVGFLGSWINDAALVQGGPGGSYVLVVMTHGLGGTRAWHLIARMSARVWQYEATR